MYVIVNANTRVVTHGMTGKTGTSVAAVKLLPWICRGAYPTLA